MVASFLTLSLAPFCGRLEAMAFGELSPEFRIEPKDFTFSKSRLNIHACLSLLTQPRNMQVLAYRKAQK